MTARCIILLVAALAIGLNGLAPLAAANDGGRDDASRHSPCQVMPATPATAGAAIGVKSLDLTVWPEAVAEIVRPASFAPPERNTTPQLPRTLLAQHILLRI